MTKRPSSSVTTIFANLVGRSVVSAITQTPASGPFGPLTTPPRSLSPTVTPAGAVCCAASCAGERDSNSAAPIAATLECRLAFGLIDALLVCLSVTAPAGDVRSGSRADESNADERSRAYPCTVYRRPQRRRARREPPDRFFGPASARASAVPWVSYGCSEAR